MRLFYDKLLYSFFDLSNSFFLTVFIIALLNGILFSFIETFLKKGMDPIIKYNQFIKNKISKENIKSNIDKMRIYNRYGYNPLFSLAELIPFILTIPFLISIFYSINEFQLFSRLPFYFINDISINDSLLFGVNLLPFIMLSVSLVIVLIEKSKINSQDLIIPSVFFILLYNSSASLLIYWTISMIINYLVKPFFKNFKFNFFPYITLSSLPYLILKIDTYYNILNLFILFSVFLFFDFFFRKTKIAWKISLPFIFTLFYGDIVNDSLIWLLGIGFWKYSYSIIFALLISILIVFLNKRYILIFSIIFSSFILIQNFDNQKINYNSNNYTSYNKKKKSSEHIVLIVLDEYASPFELNNYNDNIDFFRFSDSLKGKGWKVKDSFKTNETWTVNSLMSMFNYNLSNDETFFKEKLDENVKGELLFEETRLIKNLNEKNLKVKSYGLSSFGYDKDTSFIPLYNYEKRKQYSALSKFSTHLSFLENSRFFYDLFRRSSLDVIERKYRVEEFKANVITHLNEDKILENDFIYYHLYMPHGPFTFKNKIFNFDLDGYADFWMFTSNLLFNQINDLTENNIKIIITGDHGYRGNSNLFDPFNTFSAYWGFKPEEVDKINSVQDIGILIINSFNP